jgi:hypothetical protein
MLKEIYRFKAIDSVENIYTIIVYMDYIECTNQDSKIREYIPSRLPIFKTINNYHVNYLDNDNYFIVELNRRVHKK